MSRSLTITPAPFKSSRLAIPPSPGSPRSPFTLASASVRTTPLQAHPKLIKHQPPPPPVPSPWLWQCHVCGRIYPLATSRCLDDGHRFCSGTTTVKTSRSTGKKVVKHTACASEFDYGGWRTYNTWRKSLVEGRRGDSDKTHGPPSFFGTGETDQPTAHAKDCWRSCNFPSECRWGERVGLDKATEDLTDEAWSDQESEGEDEQNADSTTPAQTFDEILVHLQQHGDRNVEDKMGIDAKPSEQDVTQSNKRRKKRSVGQTPSPLRSNSPGPVAGGAADSAIPVQSDLQMFQAKLDAVAKRV